MQSERNRVPYPWSWEIPALAAIVFVVLAALAAQLGRAIANLIAGAGWVWPTKGLFSSLLGVLAGDGRAGISAAHVAPPWMVVGWVIATELATLAAVVVAGVWAARRWGPRRMRGMATITEARQILGVGRLRRNANIIRPDLTHTPTGGHDGYHPRS